MRTKLILTVISILIGFNLIAQDRIDSAPKQLSYKSKEIKKALYWEKNSSTGKWESRKNSKLVYEGEGIAVDNFLSVFVGDYANNRYIFLDYMKYYWQYPNLKIDWSLSRAIMAALITNDDYNKMDSLSINQVLTITSDFYEFMWKSDREYSFPFFISMNETLRSATSTLADSYEREVKGAGKRHWSSEYPTIQFITFKRVVDSNGKDVVRFRVYPHAIPDLIDTFYFEIDYSTYRNLFIKAEKNLYK